MRGFSVQSFSRTAVQTVHDHGKLLISHGIKRSGLRQILTNKAVCIFVDPTPPGRVWFSEVRCGIEGVINLSVPGELQSIVEGQRTGACFEGSERLHNGILDRLTGLAAHMGEQTNRTCARLG